MISKYRNGDNKMTDEVKGSDPLVTGNDLRKIRLVAGETTDNMAEYAGIKTRKTYENWEANRSSPNINQFIAICSRTGFDAGKLVRAFQTRNNQDLISVDLDLIDWESCKKD